VVGWGAPKEGAGSIEVIGVFGPTASGKSAVAGELAGRLATEVVSADALQVYRGLEILTNQPPEPTRLVAVRELEESMSVGEYAALAHAAIDDLVEHNGVAIVAGGTGLYLRAALADLDVPPAVDARTRSRWESAYDADPSSAFARLEEIDPRAARVVHENDRRRVVRALELADAGASLVPERDRLWSTDTRRPTLVVGLDVPADVLRARVAARFDAMLEAGARAEARSALERSISRTAAQALGLHELVELPVADARERVVARTVRYAAYQRKWMRRIPGVVMIDAQQAPGQVADAILEVARAR
jgi:tRNA dimethylallyltransferase